MTGHHITQRISNFLISTAAIGASDAAAPSRLVGITYQTGGEMDRWMDGRTPASMEKRRLPQHVCHAAQLFSLNEPSDDETKLTGVDVIKRRLTGAIYVVYFRTNSRLSIHRSRLFICPIAIAYSMGQIIKSVCVCQCICPSASTLMVAFLDQLSPKLAQT